MLRSSIVIGLAGMMALAIFALAAAGATLEDPAGGPRVVMLVGVYLALSLGAMAAIVMMPSRKWPYIIGFSMIVVPLTVLTIGH